MFPSQDRLGLLLYSVSVSVCLCLSVSLSLSLSLSLSWRLNSIKFIQLGNNNSSSSSRNCMHLLVSSSPVPPVPPVSHTNWLSHGEVDGLPQVSSQPYSFSRRPTGGSLGCRRCYIKQTEFDLAFRHFDIDVWIYSTGTFLIVKRILMLIMYSDTSL